MFSIDSFIEIQVVGLLLLLGILPLVILLNPSLRNKDGFLAHLDEIDDKTAKAVLLIVLAFSVGIAANRLFDDILDEMHIDPGSQYKTDFENWAAIPQNQAKIKCLKIAEFALAERSESIQGWLERHKLFIRVLRGAAVSFLLLLISMFVYEMARKKGDSKRRYTGKHFVVVVALFVLFSLAYWREAKGYKKHIYDLYTGLPTKEK